MHARAMCACADCASDALFIDVTKVLLGQAALEKRIPQVFEPGSAPHRRGSARGIDCLDALHLIE